ncbi:hypothetical protein, partial [Thiolapillus sp.]|uniref:hypothetical protein n=2 Tax=Thiolapillus sp. TaxID=2017437 RepID=UPI003AF526A6
QFRPPQLSMSETRHTVRLSQIRVRHHDLGILWWFRITSRHEAHLPHLGFSRQPHRECPPSQLLPLQCLERGSTTLIMSILPFIGIGLFFLRWRPSRHLGASPKCILFMIRGTSGSTSRIDMGTVKFRHALIPGLSNRGTIFSLP